MDLVRTLGIAIDPSAAKSGGAQASDAFNKVGEAAGKTERATGKANKELDAAGASMRRAKGAGDLLRETLDRQTSVLTKLDSSVRSLTAMLSRKKTAMDAATTATEQMTKAAKAATDQTNDATQATKAETLALQQSTALVLAKTAALARMATAAQAATLQLRQLYTTVAQISGNGALALPGAGGAGGGSGGGGGRNVINVTGTGGPSPQLLLQTSQAANTAAASMNLMYSKGQLAARMWTLMSAGATRARSAIAGAAQIVGDTAKQFGLIGGVAGAALLAKGSLETGMAQDRLRSTMRFATGDNETGLREIAFVRDATHRLGLEFETTSQAYGKFVAVGRMSKLTYQEIRDVFEGVSDAAAVMGLSAEESGGAMLALTQMMSKGKITAEELNQQLAERIPGAITLMAKAVGVSTSELGRMMERGELIATDVLPKFGRELKDQFGPEAVKNATSTTGAINALKNAWTDFKQSLIDAGLVSVLRKLMDVIVAVVRNLSTLPKFVAAAAAEVKAGMAAFGLDTDGFVGKGAVAIGGAVGGLIDWAKSIKIDPPDPAMHPFALPDSENYIRAPRFKVRPSNADFFQQGLYNSGDELTHLGSYTKADSVTGQLEKHMGQLEKTGEETTKAMADNFSDFFGGIVTEGGNAITRLRQMLSSLAKDIATIFARRTIAEPIAGGLAKLASGLFGGGPSPVSVGKSHAGSIVGAIGMSTALASPLLFANAPRFHNGLAPDEFPAILQRGERVVPKSQAAGWGSGGDMNITVHVDGSRGGTPAQNQSFGQEVARQIENMIDARIARAAQPRGVLRQA